LNDLPESGDGVYTLDSDGRRGTTPPRDAYCDMTTAGGGWRLISVASGSETEPFLGRDRCTEVDVPCHGFLATDDVGPESEILVRSISGADWLLYDQFSATPESALRFFTLERTLGSSTNCDDNGHSCDQPIDPDLRVRETSGFPLVENGPLSQWWNKGGWWVGAAPDAAFTNGRIHATSYGAGAHDIRQRTGDADVTEMIYSGPQALFHRILD